MTTDPNLPVRPDMGSVCSGPAPPQTMHRDVPNPDCPECGGADAPPGIPFPAGPNIHRCGMCGRPPTGHAQKGDTWYCHGDEEPSPTCYERATFRARCPICRAMGPCGYDESYHLLFCVLRSDDPKVIAKRGQS